MPQVTENPQYTTVCCISLKPTGGFNITAAQCMLLLALMTADNIWVHILNTGSPTETTVTTVPLKLGSL